MLVFLSGEKNPRGYQNHFWLNYLRVGCGCVPSCRHGIVELLNNWRVFEEVKSINCALVISSLRRRVHLFLSSCTAWQRMLTSALLKEDLKPGMQENLIGCRSGSWLGLHHQINELLELCRPVSTR